MPSRKFRKHTTCPNRSCVSGLVLLAVLIVPACTLHSREVPPEISSQTIQRVITTRACSGCQLAGADFRHQDLSRVNLSAADLRGAHFEGATLTGANLSQTQLQGAFMENAILFSTNLRGADLRGVNLINVRLAGADLRDTDMTDIDSYDQLDLMELTGVRLDGARFHDGVTCGGLPPKGGWGCVLKETGTGSQQETQSP